MTVLCNPYRYATVGGDSAKLTAWLAAMTVQPEEETRKPLLAAFIDGLEADGVLSELDGLYLFLMHDEQASRINIITPGTNTLVKVNTPVFTTDGGWTANSSINYLDTGINISTAGGNFTQNDASMFVSVLTDVSSSLGVMGTGTNNRLAPRNSTVMNIRLNRSSNASPVLTTATSKGLSAVERNGSSNINVYKNDALLGSYAHVSSALENANMGILTFSTATSGVHQVGMAGFGGYLGATKVAALRARYNTYAAAIGVSVE